VAVVDMSAGCTALSLCSLATTTTTTIFFNMALAVDGRKVRCGTID